MLRFAVRCRSWAIVDALIAHPRRGPDARCQAMEWRMTTPRLSRCTQTLSSV